MDDHVARRKRIFGLGMLVVGAVVYLVGLWPGCHTLSEKGYFFVGNRHVWFSSLNSPGTHGKWPLAFSLQIFAVAWHRHGRGRRI